MRDVNNSKKFFFIITSPLTINLITIPNSLSGEQKMIDINLLANTYCAVYEIIPLRNAIYSPSDQQKLSF